jgi:hypothetical protein
MSTIPRPPEPPEADDGPVVWYTSTTALNMRWLPGGGREVLICETPGVPLPAGVPFAIPADLTDAFEAASGPQPSNGSVSGEARTAGTIPGLKRLPGPPR